MKETPASKHRNGLGLTSVLLGTVAIVGIHVAWVCFPLAVSGFVVGMLGRKKAEKTGTGRFMSMLGVLYSILAVSLGPW